MSVDLIPKLPPLFMHAGELLHHVMMTPHKIGFDYTLSKESKTSPFLTFNFHIDPIGEGKEPVGRMHFTAVGITYFNARGQGGKTFPWSSNPDLAQRDAENFSSVESSVSAMEKMAREQAGRKALQYVAARNEAQTMTGLHLSAIIP